MLRTKSQYFERSMVIKMKIFVSGGCKNGKSTYAERLARMLACFGGYKPLYYVATMLPVDEEDETRILRHQQSRAGFGFETVELPTDIGKLPSLCDSYGSFLLDSVTALLANEMFLPGGRFNRQAHEKIAGELLQVMDHVEHMVIVSDYIYSDAVSYDPLTEDYRKALAYIDRTCAAVSDVVVEVCYGSLIVHKGEELMEDLYEALN